MSEFADVTKKRHHPSKTKKKKPKNTTTTKTSNSTEKSTKQKESKEAAKIRNPKAFISASGRNRHRIIQRKNDRLHKKEHLPLPDRTPNEPPPIIVAVQGPPGVGKTTLIQCLVKHYTKQNVTDPKGPITLISSKKRRLTFIEVPNDLNSMCDIAKIADLVLMVIDANYGFEMETFEFLNILQTHGFPKVMGILTHLDLFKKVSTLSKTKKRMKQRFWTEIYDGAKLFYLSGLLHGKYLKRDILNLSRFISTQKFRPLIWRNAHPYFMVDRMEDITDPESIRQNKKCDRTVALYGYLHGTNLKKNMKVHLPGCGDFYMKDVSTLIDPCPCPEKAIKQKLNQKDKLLYAPMSNVGELFFDRDAVYINVDPNQLRFTDKKQLQGEGEGEGDGDAALQLDEGPGEQMVRELQNIGHTVDENLESADLVLLKNSTAPVSVQKEPHQRRPAPSKNDYKNSDSDSDSEDDQQSGRDNQPEDDDDVESGKDEDEDDEDDDGDDEDEDEDDDGDGDGDGDEENDTLQSSERNSQTSRLTTEYSLSSTKGTPKKLNKRRACQEHDEESSLLQESKTSKTDTSTRVDGDESDADNAAEDEDDDEDEKDLDASEKSLKQTKSKGEDDDSDTDSQDYQDIEGSIKWKENMLERAKQNFLKPLNLMKVVYGTNTMDEQESKITKSDGGNDGDSDSENFFKVRSATTEKEDLNIVDSSVFRHADDTLLDLENEELAQLLASRFVSRDYAYDEDYGVDANDTSLYGDFEDLEKKTTSYR
eukprot:TRINITY_DN1564_c1_g2_i1.p1 TRINITY_DN1564_c1_g2~~TRINITY_DN1564_c1_g2_i1.p1  ORF type:complete len:764 (-),score=173.56 TRINITY_DN1564_c1_g2_i1:53-2344(-)